MPAIAVIIASFVLIVVMVRIRIPLWAALLAACILVMASTGLGAQSAVSEFANTLVDPEVLSLALIIAFILLFSDALKLGGGLERVVDAFKKLGPGPRTRLAAFPALIGLLPMPGGAVFSAPMVKAAGKGMTSAPGQFSAINYWFRHIWEYWWPLYPGVLIAVAVSGISIGTFAVAMMPFTLISVWIGFATLFPKPRAQSPDQDNSENTPKDGFNGSNEDRSANQSTPSGIARFRARPVGSVRSLIRELGPIIVVVVGGVGLELVRELLEKSGTSIFQPLPRTAIILALATALVFTIARDKVKIVQLLKDWVCRQNIEMILMIVLVIYYKNLLEAGGLIGRTVDELLLWNVPIWGVVVILPFLLGLITGIQFAAVGVSFPMIVGMAEAAGMSMIAVLSLGYVLAFMGVMLSPVHFCLLLTKEYFKDGFAVIYRRIAIPIVVMIASAALVAAVYARF